MVPVTNFLLLVEPFPGLFGDKALLGTVDPI
jgi:hypothetical protein